MIGWVFYFVNLEEVTFLALLFFFKILKEKDLANEKCKTAELQEIRTRLEKDSAKLGEELRACKQEFEKVLRQTEFSSCVWLSDEKYVPTQ